MKNQLKLYKGLRCNLSKSNPLTVAELVRAWHRSKKEIIKRLNEFREFWLSGSDEDIFSELAFCLFTPQSKAKSCNEAVKELYNNRLLFKGKAEDIAKQINVVRFRNNKARYVVEAIDKFTINGRLKIKDVINRFKDEEELRNWLWKNIKGLGLKEASHFLRNIGKGGRIAILDRHILRNLQRLKVINKIPKTITANVYLQIENKMKSFSKKVRIPLDHLDLLFWGRETGEIFK